MFSSAVVEFGPLRVDLRDERLWHGPAVLPLTPKAFAVLPGGPRWPARA
jgi:DNA-binding response OmpR family regulator